MIKSEPKSRASKQNINPVITVPGLGTHPSAKIAAANHYRLESRARTGHGPGVFMSGAAPRRYESVRQAPCLAAVRHGTDPVAVPL
ncbi:MAG TPA: hypothetical protein VKZ64_05880 [Arenimonas sp.]|nr:hypothetical protein [Arenimonas sp.]